MSNLNSKQSLVDTNLIGLRDLLDLISQQFSNSFNTYTKTFNKMYEMQGSLLNRPFKRKEVNSDDNLTKLIHYIHNNPIHHGFIPECQDWKRSSFHTLRPHF